MRIERIACGLALAVGISRAQTVAGPGPAHCQSMTALRIPGVALEVTGAEWIKDGTDPQALPPYCRVDGILNRRTGVGGVEYGIRFALALPENWNGDFLMQGGGALNGSVQPPVGAQATGGKSGLARGFAVVSTDTGHKGTGLFDPSFLQDEQAALDFAYQAIGRVSETAKQIIASYFGHPASHSYFSGCSTGGREAMILTQRYPTYFDGVVAGAPAMRTGFSNLADRWAAVSYGRIAPKDASGNPIPGGALSETDRKLVVDALIDRCDARDGLRDGMIFDVKGCDFDPAVLLCLGAKNDKCLTSQQAGAIKRAFAGPTDSRGFRLYPGFPFDTGINAKRGIPGLLAPGPSPVGPPRSPTEQDVDKESLTASNPLVDSIATNLTTFAGHGGKLLFYHGVSDPWFSAFDTLTYYQAMAAANGGAEKVMSWSRLYLVPGMGHCGGGDATLDNFDMLGAVVNWVEKGQAPDSVIATGKSFPGRSRPLCPYPQHAQNAGHGDPETAQSFVCRE